MSAAGPSTEDLGSLALLIPVWQPTRALPELLAATQRLGFGLTVVVDDGSDTDQDCVFQEILALPRVKLLRHEVNLGKGRALKTGMTYLLKQHRGIAGVVTADADGQHLPEDIVRVARVLAGAGEQPVLGVRRFGANVPLRSRLGNAAMRRFFRWTTGRTVADTQSGLRGLPYGLLPGLVTLPGERYEYETVMLASLCRSARGPIQLPIATVYLDGNRSSHFKPLSDSLRVLRVLLRL